MSTIIVDLFLLACLLVIANNTGMDKISFPEQLKIFRSQKNMTQDELGVAVGVSRFTVLDWESGKRTPTIDMLPKISDILGVSIVDLIDTGGSKRSEGNDDPVLSSPMDTFIGERIKILRKKIPGRVIAERAGITQAYFSQIELGQKDPSLSVLKAIAEALSTSVAYLIGETDDPELPTNATNMRVASSKKTQEKQTDPFQSIEDSSTEDIVFEYHENNHGFDRTTRLKFKSDTPSEIIGVVIEKAVKAVSNVEIDSDQAKSMLKSAVGGDTSES